MAVNDHGLEVIRKSAEQVVSGSAADYYLKTSPFGSFQAPSQADAITVEYPNSTTEIYKYRLGGVSGTILMTLTLTYTSSTKENLSSVVKT